jgi:hypothetical protein
MSNPTRSTNPEPRTDMVDVGRDDYTWHHATKDLALMSRLTFREASAVTYELGKLPREVCHPYDALPMLLVLFDDDLERTVRQKGYALAQLIGKGTTDDD